MDLRQLEYFSMISKLNSFTQAAKQLHIAQPSITNAIHKLEESLGVQLFNRYHKKVILTSEGQIFLQRAEHILREVQNTVREMDDLKLLNRGTIKIGVPLIIGAYVFPNIFMDFKQSYPNLDIAVFDQGSLAVQAMLEQAELDLGLIILPTSTDILNTIPILTQQIVLCLPKYHPLSGNQCICFDQLKEADFILLNDDTYLRGAVIDQCRKYGFAPRIVFSSNQIRTSIDLVSGGVGVSFMMDIVAQAYPGIVAVPLAEPVEVRIGLAWNMNKGLSKAAQAFINFLQKQYT